MKKNVSAWTIVLLVIVCILLGSRLRSDHLELLELRGHAEAREVEKLAAGAEIERLRIQLADLEKKDQERSTVNSSQEGKRSAFPQGGVDLGAFIRKDPAYAELHRRSMLFQVKMNYGDLRALKLPPDQLQKLTELLIDQYSLPDDTQEAAIQNGMRTDSPEYLKLMGDANRELSDQIKTLLGPAAYQELQDASARNGLQTNLELNLGKSLEISGAPLSGDQISSLVDARMKSLSLPGDARDQAFDTAASQVLTPEQYGLYAEDTAIQRETHAMVQRAMEAAKQQYGEVNSWHYNNP
jgi:hypothetical protein